MNTSGESVCPPAATDDELCLQLLAEWVPLDEDQRAGVRAWWLAERMPQEELVTFLARRQIFHLRSAEEIDLIERGYVSVSTINHLFAPRGLELLRKQAAVHGRAHLKQALSGDTVVAAPPDTQSLRELKQAASDEPPATQMLATLPIVRPRPAAEPVEVAVGQRLGNYLLSRLIGRGPKGIVFEAEDLALNRPVAVKVLAPEMAARGNAWTQRFLLEARLASRVENPLILSIFAVGQEAGLVYYSMPLVRNGSARDVLRAEGRFAPIEATRIVRQAARALAVAHAQGLSHGNLKPSNIFLGDDGEVKIADFTIPHLPLESPAGAELRAQDVATDLRLLGATYHWLLTGKPPAETADSTIAADAAVPEACARIIGTALSRRRGYGSAGEMAVALADAEETLRITETADVFGKGNAETVLPPRPRTAEVGQMLGKCLLTERIGRGSAGIVFRARHQTLNIPVAVKVLHLAGESSVYRQLRSEARLLAQLNHPHIVRVWDFEDDPTLPYLVLEFVEGPNLAEVLQQQGRMAPGQAVRLVGQVADGLAAAQRLGIVHRDVKPGNILLARDGTAKLADLGLAVFVDPNRGNPTGRGLAGTVAYMPPEQATSTGIVDHRSDIYSLGATFYQLVTGQIPFLGATRMEVILKHATEVPLPPHELVPGLPDAVSNVILRMLAKAPANRYTSYDELLAALGALDGLLNGGPDAAARRGPFRAV